jgi:hypothetical protein
MTEPTLQTIDVNGLRMAWGPLQISAAAHEVNGSYDNLTGWHCVSE